MSISKWLTSNIDKYDNWDEWIADCSNQCGVTRQAVLKKSHSLWTLRGGKKENLPSAQPAKKSTSSMNRSQFLSKYDTSTKTRDAIRRAVSTLIEEDDPEKDQIVEDVDFRMNRCDNVSIQFYRQTANEPEFEKYQFRMGDKIFWTTPRQVQWAVENVPKARPLNE